MADVSVKMGVSGITQFKQGMNDAAASVKTFDAALAANEKQLKLTGNAEEYMQAKVQLLNGKLEAQQNAAKNAEAALRQMEQNGVKTTSAAYQNMQRKLIEAQTGILDTQQAIKGLGTQTTEAAGKVEKLEGGLKGLNQKVSLEQVRSAIGSITDGMEKAAKKAADMAEAVWGAMMDSAQWADDSATMAMMYGVDLDTFLRVQKLVQNGMDTSVEAILKSQSKLRKNVGSGSESFTQTMQELGLTAKDSTDLFWEAGKALMSLGDEYEQENKAQILFGKSWRELIPLFTQFSSQAEFEEALAGVNVNTVEEVDNLEALNDKVGELEGNLNTLKNSLLATMAPALTAAAETLNGLLGSVMDYLATPEGQAALGRMEEAVSGLFEGLGDISAETVVGGFESVFGKLIESLEWIKNNGELVKAALIAIGAGFGALKLTGAALDVLKLVNGLKDLIGTGTSAASAAGSAAGTAWGSGFAAAVMKAAPWLAGLYTLLNPAESASNDQDILFDEKTGKMTSAGWEDFINNPQNWADTMAEIGQIFGDMGRIATDEDAINAMAKYRMSGDLDVLIQEMEALGYIQKIKDEETNESGVQETVTTQEGPGGIIYQYDAEGNKIGTIFPTAGAAEGGGAAAEEIVNSLGEGGEITIPAKLDIEDTEQDLQGMAEEALAEPVDIPSVAELPEDMQQQLQANIDSWGPLKIYITPILGDLQGGLAQGHANGLPYVPFDGYAAILHKGERVVPANQNGGSRSFSSNLYVESMYMNNGTDAEGLASAIAAANRRTMSGYGS